MPERFPDLHFSLIEFNAYWLASLVGSMDKCWVTGIGQDADWWIGVWDDARPDDDQPDMAQLFRLNEKWPYPLMPSEYVQRQFHVSFQDDPVAVACRHITGLSTVVWGNDYPHAEGTFRGSQELLAAADGRRPRRRPQGAWSAARSATCSASPRSRPDRRAGRESVAMTSPIQPTRESGGRERATASTGASRSSPARGAASAAPTRGCSPSAGRAVVVNDLGGSTGGDGRRRRAGRRGGRRDRRRRRHGDRRHQRRVDRRRAHGRSSPPRSSGSAASTSLVNNAGIMRWAGMPDVDADNLDAHLAVHVGGSFNTDPGGLAAHGRAGLRPHRA